MELKQKPFGFWYSHHHQEFPAIHASIFDNSEILSRLRVIEKSIDDGTVEGGTVESYRGFSCCRVCNNINGSREYALKLNGAEYRWPSGLAHYLEVHNIEPPLELRELVGFHELVFKIMPGNPYMELFPFYEHNVEDGDVISFWADTLRKKGQMYSRIHLQVLSATSAKFVVMADGESEPVYNETLTVEPELLADIITGRKYSLAMEEYKERERFYREKAVRELVIKMFGE